jgi:hypothetical protein
MEGEKGATRVEPRERKRGINSDNDRPRFGIHSHNGPTWHLLALHWRLEGEYPADILRVLVDSKYINHSTGSSSAARRACDLREH